MYVYIYNYNIYIYIYIYIYDVTKLFHFQLPNVLLKFAYFRNQKSSLGKIKNIFYNFIRALFL